MCLPLTNKAHYNPCKRAIPDSKVYGACIGPTWARQDPSGPHVGPMNLVIWDNVSQLGRYRHDASSMASMPVRFWHVAARVCMAYLMVVSNTYVETMLKKLRKNTFTALRNNLKSARTGLNYEWWNGWIGHMNNNTFDTNGKLGSCSPPQQGLDQWKKT